MLILKTKWLARFARREQLSDASLREAIDRAARGIIDADLGGGLIKQRVTRSGQGRSGGYRMLIGYKAEDRAVFLYGFAKNERENISEAELLSLRTDAAYWLNTSYEQLASLINDGSLQEIKE
jgi:hypothetical protein